MIQKRRLNEYLAIAPDVVEDILLNDKGMVDREYDGAISKFGVAIRQMDLLAAVTAYKNQGKSKSDKGKILDAIGRIINLHQHGIISENYDLLKEVEKAGPNKNLLKKKIILSATALKMAARLYMVKDEKETYSDDDYDSE